MPRRWLLRRASARNQSQTFQHSPAPGACPRLRPPHPDLSICMGKWTWLECILAGCHSCIKIRSNLWVSYKKVVYDRAYNNGNFGYPRFKPNVFFLQKRHDATGRVEAECTPSG